MIPIIVSSANGLLNRLQIGLKQWATLFSIIMNLEERATYITEGSPCQGEYYKLTPQRAA